MVCANVILMVVNIAFERTNRKRSMRKRMGVEMGAMQQSNGVGRGGGEDGGGTKVSNNLLILFARAPSLYSRYTPFLCLSTDSPCGQKIVDAGL